MSWAEPCYPRQEVNRAARAYLAANGDSDERAHALVVINNWRSSHSFPLNTFQNNLRKVARDRDSKATIAQRIKRLPSIRHKLERMDSMNLSQMNDIGGCRAVLSSVGAVDDVVDYYLDKSQMKHRCLKQYPYIAKPKASGYRGVHLVYAYRSDRKHTYNDLRIELQIRSRLQHAWATAVETVGIFTQQALKSSWGDEETLRFFALMGSTLARREGTPIVPGTPTSEKGTVRELRQYVHKHNVVERLRAFTAVVDYSTGKGSEVKDTTFLLHLHVSAQEQGSLTVRAFKSTTQAADEYAALEREIEGQAGQDAVLVTVESIAALERAYPNYFLDTTVFLEAVEEAIA